MGFQARRYCVASSERSTGLEAHRTADDLEAHRTADDLEAHRTADDLEAHRTADDLEAHRMADGLEAHRTADGQGIEKALIPQPHESSASSCSMVSRICCSPSVPCQFISPCHQRRMNPCLSIR